MSKVNFAPETLDVSSFIFPIEEGKVRLQQDERLTKYGLFQLHNIYVVFFLYRSASMWQNLFHLAPPTDGATSNSLWDVRVHPLCNVLSFHPEILFSLRTIVVKIELHCNRREARQALQTSAASRVCRECSNTLIWITHDVAWVSVIQWYLLFP